MNLINLAALTEADVQAIWNLVATDAPALSGTVAWSFEGNGIRTRATFIQAFRELGLAFTELPNFLKTGEAVRDLAGYLDPFFQLYVIRESDHERLSSFARASIRPVINAMSARGHPCEVLTDAYYIHHSIKPIPSARICLWGPTTNVFRSWHELAQVMGLQLTQVCEERFHEPHPHVQFVSTSPPAQDVVITDAWPAGSESPALALSMEHLVAMGRPALLPTPPFTVGRELLLDPLRYPAFTGYSQKTLLLPVHKAIIRFAMQAVG